MLRTIPLSIETRRRYEQQLAEADAVYERAPTDVDSIIWLGRREGYLGPFRKAIEIYTRAISLYPYDARLYRHRGHRYISAREFNNSIVDFERAARLTEGRPVRVEPHKGELPVDSVFSSHSGERPSVQDVTTAYGVANWHLYNGRRDEAERFFRQILASRPWGAFGYIAAEADLARMGYAKPAAVQRAEPRVAPVWRGP